MGFDSFGTILHEKMKEMKRREQVIFCNVLLVSPYLLAGSMEVVVVRPKANPTIPAYTNCVVTMVWADGVDQTPPMVLKSKYCKKSADFVRIFFGKYKHRISSESVVFHDSDTPFSKVTNELVRAM
tara:strand:- start:693 stop:1070 length:378 start_codon:yes stop_codon:yes gene_type:complete